MYTRLFVVAPVQVPSAASQAAFVLLAALSQVPVGTAK